MFHSCLSIGRLDSISWLIMFLDFILLSSTIISSMLDYLIDLKLPHNLNNTYLIRYLMMCSIITLLIFRFCMSRIIVLNHITSLLCIL